MNDIAQLASATEPARRSTGECEAGHGTAPCTWFCPHCGWNAPEELDELDNDHVLLSRTWSDEYPDTLTVCVQRCSETDRASVVFCSQAAWMNDEQIGEVIDFLKTAREAALAHNASVAATTPAPEE